MSKLQILLLINERNVRTNIRVFSTDEEGFAVC